MTTTDTKAPSLRTTQPSPRLASGSRHEIGRANWAIARLLGLAAGTSPPHLFTTLARHRRLFRPWLRFAGTLMPRGELPRGDSELLILRVAWLCDCEYEWRHHERIAGREGLDAAAVARIRRGPEAEGWTPRQAVLLRAADELHERRTLSDERWQELRPLLSDAQLIEICMLVGHYEMLAMTLNALAVVPDVLAEQAPSALARVVQRRLLRSRPRPERAAS